ncbi:Reticulon-like protein B4 [Zea mays]|uniref:Reticulon-like protein n=1 Tax=Zea mays TaxID=4577 RepID=A0A1D6I341_MAIZE|nr:Reticulon-like protein B4 [Zea mays]
MGYHLLTLVCHCLILTLAILFLWSSAMVFINKCPNIPEVKIPNDLTLNVARSLRYEINMGFATLWVIGQDHELKKFLIVVAGLWILSVHGSCCNFLTLSYIVLSSYGFLYAFFVVLYIVPVLYEQHGDKVDAFGDKAMLELKYYTIFDEKCL